MGIAYTIEALADPFLRSGQLVRVLEDWSPPSTGSSSTVLATGKCRVALRALIDMLRSARGSVPPGGLLEEDYVFCGLGFHVAPEPVSAGHDVHQGAVVPGGQCTGRALDQ